MTISSKSLTALKSLVASTHELLADLREYCESQPATERTGSDAAANVERYLALVMRGWQENDVQLALKGSNLLTTVNKGINDADTTVNQELISDKAYRVMLNAIAAANHLRADAGMLF